MQGNLLELIGMGFEVILTPTMLLLLVFGIFLGTLFGALPGVSATMAVTLGIPFTYKMDSVSAIAFLVAVYVASITGGGMTAILFKIPGVPSSAPTTYDGYPMAQRGEAGKALGIQLICSAIGGVFSALCMFLLSPQLTQAALSFGPSELFAISFLGLSILTSLESDNICRTIISGLLGLVLACIGLDPLLGVPRMTFGTTFLTSGIEMIPVMIGFFAVTEVLKQTVKRSKLEAVGAIDKLTAGLSGDQKTGATIVRKAMESPLRQIAVNAGLEGSVIIDKILTAKKKNYGFNAQTEEYGDMIKMGIVDPTKVTRNAVENATSVASMVLTTESLVADEPEPPAPPMPAGGMGGMDGMY